MVKTISIKELNIDSIRPNTESLKSNLGGSKITIIGKPGSGKSVLIKHLLYAKKHVIPTGLVISGSEDSNKFYSRLFPDLFIYEKYKKDVVENFIKRQKLAKEHLPNGWSVLVMDDCMDDIKIFNDPLLQGLFKNGRHWNMMAIFANQYVFDFKPNIRTNIDGVFIFREPNQANREKIYKNFASIIPSYTIFCQLMNELTTDYTCIYINNQIQSNEWTDAVFYFKADQVPDFRFGCDDYLQFAETRQRDEE
jgi:ABC-type dipeptide/oligopeptide/nickel transport system ATPase component